MKVYIHPYLVARFIAVQAAFMQPGFRFPIAIKNTQQPEANNTKKSNWEALLKKDEDDEGDGGGGTIKGLRGKNAVHAAAMRRLTRGGGR